MISPTLGHVLYAGQEVRVEWKSTLPNVRYVAWCEMEVWLSLDGGRTFPMCITPILDPKATHFDWTVPNMPSNAAVLDIRFGCDGVVPGKLQSPACVDFCDRTKGGALLDSASVADLADALDILRRRRGCPPRMANTSRRMHGPSRSALPNLNPR